VMSQRPTIKVVDNPVAVGSERLLPSPDEERSPSPSEPTKPTKRRRPTSQAVPPEQPQPMDFGTNPYAGMRKMQAPVRLFPPLWDHLEELVRELRAEDIELDKTALLNAVLHFYGPADTEAARELINQWRALLARPPAPRR
jgi:hypothetical protein